VRAAGIGLEGAARILRPNAERAHVARGARVDAGAKAARPVHIQEITVDRCPGLLLAEAALQIASSPWLWIV
jgi:hypothetical protein